MQSGKGKNKKERQRKIKNAYDKRNAFSLQIKVVILVAF